MRHYKRPITHVALPVESLTAEHLILPNTWIGMDLNIVETLEPSSICPAQLTLKTYLHLHRVGCK